MLRFHRTSLLNSQAQTVVNTVNVVGVMGKGLAAEFKSRHPEMFKAYKSACDQRLLQPGSLWMWKGKDQWVLNFATKKHWRNPSKIEYVEAGLREFRASYSKLGIREISFPRLGCGNGGLNWAEVRPLMVGLLHDLPISIYIHDFEQPLGKPEHELPLMRHSPPKDFSGFLSDVYTAIERNHGKIGTIGLSAIFTIESDQQSGTLRGVGSCTDVVATEEDLFRLWSLLQDYPVAKFDLPGESGRHALKLMSLLAELPYIRPVNLGTRRGRTNLAIEMMRDEKSEPIPMSA